MSHLAADLKASLLAEQIVNRVLAAKTKLPKGTYQRLLNRLASRFEVESVESEDLDPQTLHAKECGCEHCRNILQLAF